MNRSLKPAHRPCRWGRRRRTAGFTLIEVLVATIIFAFITVASSFALSSALRSQATLRERADFLQEIRGIAAVLRSDIRYAYASEGNPNTLFISGGSMPGALLTFTTMNGRIVRTLQGSDQQETAESIPQSDIRTVSYAHDPSTGLLTRVESPVPGTDAISMSGETAGTPQTILARRVRNIVFEFYDAENQTIRQDWSYLNDPSASESGQTAGQTAGQTTGQTSDTSLPQSVHVEMEIETSDGRIEQQTLVIPLATPTPAPAGQTPPAPAATGTGGTGGNGGNGGNNLGTSSLPGLSGLGTRP